MKPLRFQAAILAGHKEAAVEVPFDPAKRWGATPVLIRVGRRGFPVRASIGSKSFESFIVKRSRRFFLLLGPQILARTGTAIGEVVTVSASVFIPGEPLGVPWPAQGTSRRRARRSGQ